MTASSLPQKEKPQVVTFGCRLNTFESAVIQGHLDQAGEDNTIVVNTCAVTSEAERQARQSIRRLHRKHPEAKIIATGCGAQINPDAYMAIEGVTRVIGNQEKMKPETYGQGEHPAIQVSDIMTVKETAGHLISGFEGRARAFIEIQNGCNHRCTFCTIPFGRGNNRSVPMGDIVKQMIQLTEEGCQEIVFTGVDITDYGKDLPGQPTLGQLVRRTLACVPNLPRLRLSSLDPIEIDDQLYQVIASDPRLMPHFHISLQAGDDMTLKRMKRRHLRRDIINFCETVQRLRPDAVFGADIIAGFPTETEDMFNNSLSLVTSLPITHVHAFPYSPRPGTPAAKMPQLPPKVAKARAKQLIEAGQAVKEAWLKAQIGKTTDVLIEKENQGHCTHYAMTHVLSKVALTSGKIYPVTITDATDRHLIGKLVTEEKTS
ncbi:tRNA (N(6)-L-threonylcarbamoyladenosine(37)-C(2))-methylthiotransferase MtaB [Alphaproteobacteria bacterium]|nr:tRNA (N(6)-L-threonylcarbamoyladenosine(37)-C(2))-methylthiotransferase MtaB [Alphaproteobacteria bacterium]